MLNRLDFGSIELTPDKDLDNEIQQSDEYKERIYSVLTSVDKVLNTTAAHTTLTLPTIVPDHQDQTHKDQTDEANYSSTFQWQPDEVGTILGFL